MPVLYGLHLCSYKELKQLLSLFFALCKLREGGEKCALHHACSCLDCNNENIWNLHTPGATLGPSSAVHSWPLGPISSRTAVAGDTEGLCSEGDKGLSSTCHPRPPQERFHRPMGQA